MKEQLKRLIISNIEKWTDTDIYAISLFVYDDCDNPCKPTVTLGYNTENQIENELKRNPDKEEVRWNYAFWLQNNFLCFGIDDTADIVKNWINENNLPYYDDEDSAWDNDEIYEETEKITEAFVNELISIVQEIHEQGILTQKFGKEIPVIIHELEYYDEIAEQNVKANGWELIEEFVKFCNG